jgi:acetyl-CoA carboxylase biotin carboxyl carrier protein
VTVVVRSPAVGTVVEVLVAVGDVVVAGQEVAVIESMKVEIPVTALGGGTVDRLAVSAGAHVQVGDALLALVAPDC